MSFVEYGPSTPFVPLTKCAVLSPPLLGRREMIAFKAFDRRALHHKCSLATLDLSISDGQISSAEGSYPVDCS